MTMLKVVISDKFPGLAFSYLKFPKIVFERWRWNISVISINDLLYIYYILIYVFIIIYIFKYLY